MRGSAIIVIFAGRARKETSPGISTSWKPLGDSPSVASGPETFARNLDYLWNSNSGNIAASVQVRAIWNAEIKEALDQYEWLCCASSSTFDSGMPIHCDVCCLWSHIPIVFLATLKIPWSETGGGNTMVWVLLWCHPQGSIHFQDNGTPQKIR
jgi:hypothetical protein